MLKHVLEHRASSETRPLHFYASSAGNAGLACVTAATSLGYKSTVILPTTSEPGFIEKLYSAGASGVITHGQSWYFANEHLLEVVVPAAEARGEKAICIHPFDDPSIWDGASSMIDEISAQMPGNEKPDAVVCSVGGGGLFAGIMQGLDRHGWADSTQVLAVETRGAHSLAYSLQRKALTRLPAITSVADSLGAIRVAERAFREAQRPNVTSMVLEDVEACEACWRFLDDERILVEPACGASVAMAYDRRLQNHLSSYRPESKVVIIVCGGSKISLDLLERYRRMYTAAACDS